VGVEVLGKREGKSLRQSGVGRGIKTFLSYLLLLSKGTAQLVNIRREVREGGDSQKEVGGKRVGIVAVIGRSRISGATQML